MVSFKMTASQKAARKAARKANPKPRNSYGPASAELKELALEINKRIPPKKNSGPKNRAIPGDLYHKIYPLASAHIRRSGEKVVKKWIVSFLQRQAVKHTPKKREQTKRSNDIKKDHEKAMKLAGTPHLTRGSINNRNRMLRCAVQPREERLRELAKARARYAERKASRLEKVQAMREAGPTQTHQQVSTIIQEVMETPLEGLGNLAPRCEGYYAETTMVFVPYSSPINRGKQCVYINDREISYRDKSARLSAAGNRNLHDRSRYAPHPSPLLASTTRYMPGGGLRTRQQHGSRERRGAGGVREGRRAGDIRRSVQPGPGGRRLQGPRGDDDEEYVEDEEDEEDEDRQDEQDEASSDDDEQH
ncbi:hypothetical protein B484DRAFT_438395 [Ochromonadaceae sp. CCMP2298]|nr:hypothetical protein B484DRAFT_438395 [Ochromonadaceae sp. CCMP2298]